MYRYVCICICLLGVSMMAVNGQSVNVTEAAESLYESINAVLKKPFAMEKLKQVGMADAEGLFNVAYVLSELPTDIPENQKNAERVKACAAKTKRIVSDTLICWIQKSIFEVVEGESPESIIEHFTDEISSLDQTIDKASSHYKIVVETTKDPRALKELQEDGVVNAEGLFNTTYVLSQFSKCIPKEQIHIARITACAEAANHHWNETILCWIRKSLFDDRAERPWETVIVDIRREISSAHPSVAAEPSDLDSISAALQRPDIVNRLLADGVIDESGLFDTVNVVSGLLHDAELNRDTILSIIGCSLEANLDVKQTLRCWIGRMIFDGFGKVPHENLIQYMKGGMMPQF